MGSPVGVYSEKELKALKPQARAKLKARVLREILTSNAIRAILKKNPKLLTKNAAVRKILKKNTTPTLKQLKGR